MPEDKTDETPEETSVETPEETSVEPTDDLNLPISREVYIAALKVELSTASDKAHKAAIIAELDRVSLSRAVAPEKETA